MSKSTITDEVAIGKIPTDFPSMSFPAAQQVFPPASPVVSTASSMEAARLRELGQIAALALDARFVSAGHIQQTWPAAGLNR